MQTEIQDKLVSFLMPFDLPVFAVSEDESFILFNSNASGQYNLWKMELYGDMKQTQLTFHNQNIESIAISNSVFFTSDKDGNENMHIYSIDLTGENWREVRTIPNCRYFFGGLSDDGSTIYYTSTLDNPNFLSIFSYQLKTNTETLLHQGYGAETHLLEVSPNGKDFAYFIRYNHSNMKIFVKKDGHDVELIPDASQHYRVSNLRFLHENKVLFTTDYQEEFSYLASYEFSSGIFEKVVEIEKQDIASIQFLTSKEEIVLQTLAGPIGCLYLYNLNTKDLVDLKAPTDTIQQVSISKSGTIYLTGSSSTKPISLFKKGRDGEWILLIDNPVPTIPSECMVEPFRINYCSFDGTEIEAMFYQASEEYWNGHTIVYPHGGPQYNEQIEYYGFFQYLLRSGYHIFAPNFRGTTNYGTSFLKMIEGDWGGGPRLDILEGMDILVKKGMAEPDQFILFGGSYGGYLSLLLFGRHQERFKACIDIFGPTNLFTLIETCPEHWKERMYSWIGDPIKDRDRLLEQSPITYVKNISKPLFILQGANDPRVKKSESDQIVEALAKNGISFEYIVFDDEGHGFGKKENEIKAYREVKSFLDRVVGDN